MKLVASLIIRNELHRYLEPCIDHLREFVDAIVIFDDGSTDDWQNALWPGRGAPILIVRASDADKQAGSMFVNHARARQHLLDATVENGATHILAIDADEFVADGAQLRRACETEPADTLALCLQEVWNADADGFQVRQDGGWAEHDVAMVWRPDRVRQALQIVDRGPATGRTPDFGRVSRGYACTQLLHFGWANQAERADRHHRYVVADGGRFHNAKHLDSIMWPDSRVILTGEEWPVALLPWRDEILAHVTSPVSP